MGLPLFDKLGTPTTFLFDGGFCNLSGQYVAYLINEHVFGLAGQHVGWWEDDCVRGHDGGVMVWALGAQLGLHLPKPYTAFTMPNPVAQPARSGFPNFNVPDRPLDFVAWSREMFPVF